MEQIEQWAKQWDQAQSKGIFKDAEKPPKVSQNTSYESFFGPTDTHQKDDPDDFESKYWSNVYNLSMGAPPEPEVEEEAIPEDGDGVAVIRDSVKPTKKKSINENAAASKVGKKAAVMANSSNPVRSTSVGMDQDMSPESLGLTFSPEDLEELAGLKNKLHDLQVKLAAYEGKGQSGKQVETQIRSLVQKINELSDSLSQAFPDEIMHQGD